MTPDIIKNYSLLSQCVNPLIWAFSIDFFFLSGCALFKYTDFPRKHFYIYRYKLNTPRKEVLVSCSGTLSEFMQSTAVGSSNKLDGDCKLKTSLLYKILLLQPSKRSYTLPQNGAVHYLCIQNLPPLCLLTSLTSKSSQWLLEPCRISSKIQTFYFFNKTEAIKKQSHSQAMVAHDFSPNTQKA